MDVVSGTKHPHHSPAPARCTKPHCRWGVSDNGRLVRLETEPDPVQENCQSLWSNRGRPVCIPLDCTVPSLFQLVARSLCGSNRCFSAGLVSDTGICQPSMESNRASPVTGSGATGLYHSGGTSLEDTTFVPTTSRYAEPLSDQTPSDNAQSRLGESVPTASHVAYLRVRYRYHELSEEATSLLLKSWRTKTHRSYDSLIRKWHSWCHSRGSDPFSGHVKEVVNLLANLHDEGYTYRSLNSYRSAISSVHERVDGCPVGQHR